MKRKLIIHVGMGKTGSSSIQKTLRVAKGALEDQGIKYLGLMLEQLPSPKPYTWHTVSGWRDFIEMDPTQANRELAHVFQYANDKLPDSIHTLVWSNESLFDGFKNVRPTIEALRDYYEIHVIGYLRRPDSWISSAYLQWGIKDKSYPGPLKTFRAWAGKKPYVVSVKADVWTELADQASFFNFDKLEDVSAHFVEEVLSLAKDTAPSLRANDTPPPAAMAFFAYHNSLYEGMVLPDKLGSLLTRAGLFNKMQESPPYNKLLPTVEDISNYVERNRPEIERVNSLLEANGQQGFDLTEINTKDYSATPLDTNRALLQLVVYLAEEVEQLKARMNEKEGAQ